VIATSGRAVEAAGDVDVLLLDKTGTITLGNRQASRRSRPSGVASSELADAAQLASLADETPEGRSIVVLGQGEIPAARARAATTPSAMHFVPFTAQTRMSGVDLSTARADPQGRGGRDARPCGSRRAARLPAGRCSRPSSEVGAPGQHAAGGGRGRDACSAWSSSRTSSRAASRSALPSCAAWASSTVMITGDNPLTAAAIAAEAGVDDFLAEATPEAKLKLIRDHQAEGRLVAMTGDGTNDAPGAGAGRCRPWR
jgi:K+-transporting ATPase ATPase B chain